MSGKFGIIFFLFFFGFYFFGKNVGADASDFRFFVCKMFVSAMMQVLDRRSRLIERRGNLGTETFSKGM